MNDTFIYSIRTHVAEINVRREEIAALVKEEIRYRGITLSDVCQWVKDLHPHDPERAEEMIIEIKRATNQDK